MVRVARRQLVKPSVEAMYRVKELDEVALKPFLI